MSKSKYVKIIENFIHESHTKYTGLVRATLSYKSLK